MSSKSPPLVERSEPPPLIGRSEDPLTKTRIKRGDSVIVLRENGEVEVYVHMDKEEELNYAAVTALGLMWCLERPEWRRELCIKAKRRIEEIIAGREKA